MIEENLRYRLDPIQIKPAVMKRAAMYRMADNGMERKTMMHKLDKELKQLAIYLSIIGITYAAILWTFSQSRTPSPPYSLVSGILVMVGGPILVIFVWKSVHLRRLRPLRRSIREQELIENHLNYQAYRLDRSLDAFGMLLQAWMGYKRQVSFNEGTLLGNDQELKELLVQGHQELKRQSDVVMLHHAIDRNIVTKEVITKKRWSFLPDREITGPVPRVVDTTSENPQLRAVQTVFDEIDEILGEVADRLAGFIPPKKT